MGRRSICVTGAILLLAVLLPGQVLASQCSERLAISEDEAELDSLVGELLSTVSEAVQDVRDPREYSLMYQSKWFIMPGSKRVIGQVSVVNGREAEMVENLQGVFERVGDLALAVLGDWSLGIVFKDSDYSLLFSMGYLPTLLSEERTSLTPGQLVVVEERRAVDVAQGLELVSAVLLGLEPTENMRVEIATYVPGCGAFLGLRYPGGFSRDQLDECHEWIPLIDDVLSRVGDLLFDALEAGESLVVYTGNFFWPNEPIFISITAETLDAPEQWEVYVVEDD